MKEDDKKDKKDTHISRRTCLNHKIERRWKSKIVTILPSKILKPIQSGTRNWKEKNERNNWAVNVP